MEECEEADSEVCVLGSWGRFLHLRGSLYCRGDNGVLVTLARPALDFPGWHTPRAPRPWLSNAETPVNNPLPLPTRLHPAFHIPSTNHALRFTL